MIFMCLLCPQDSRNYECICELFCDKNKCVFDFCRMNIIVHCYYHQTYIFICFKLASFIEHLTLHFQIIVSVAASKIFKSAFIYILGKL